MTSKQKKAAAAALARDGSRPISPKSLDRLAALLRAGAPRVGMDPAAVDAGRQGVALVGTGVDVEWRADARGRGMAGWVVTETTHETNLLTNEGGLVTEAIVAGEDGDEFEIACQALLRVARRLVEFAMEDAGV